MNFKSIAAVALTLIIIVPIGLGFGLASEDEEVEKTIVTDSSSISDMILNSSTNYYMAFNGPDNNSNLFDIGRGVLVSPDYLSTGTTPTSLPIYERSYGASTQVSYTNTVTNGPSASTGTATTTTTAASSSIYYLNEDIDSAGVAVVASGYSTTLSGVDMLSSPSPVMTIYIGDDLIEDYPPNTPQLYLNDTYVMDVPSQTYLHLVLDDDGLFSLGYYSSSGWVSTTDIWSFALINPDPASTTVVTDVIHTAAVSLNTPTTIEVQSFALIDLEFTITTYSGGTMSTETSMWSNVAETTRYSTTTVDVGSTYIAVYNGASTSPSRLVWSIEGISISNVSIGALSTWTNGAQSPSAATITTSPSATLTLTPSDIPYFLDGITQNSAASRIVVTVNYTSNGTPYSDSYEQDVAVSGFIISRIDIANNQDGTMKVEYRNPTSLSQYTTFSYPSATSLQVTVWGPSITLQSRVVTTPGYSPDMSGSWYLSLNPASEYALIMTIDGATVVRTGLNGLSYIEHIGSSLTTSIGTFNDVSALSIIGNPDTISTISYTDSGEYADPNIGWLLPRISNDGFLWTNGFDNIYVRMMVSLPTLYDITIDLEHGVDTLLTIARSDSSTSITHADGSAQLGDYTNLMIEINVRDSTIIVSGIMSWPAVGFYPQTFNQVVIDHNFSSDLSSLQITEGGVPLAGRAHYRVDTASIRAGTFPSTVDYTLNLYAYWPQDAHQRVYITSVAVYGDSITIGGRTLPVTNGAVTVDDSPIQLLHATIDIIRDGSAYQVSINDTGWESSSPEIVFNGEWSLTMNRQTIGQKVTTETHWTPGEFALDDNGFVLVMLLAAVGAFVVLGMTGARSGAKVGLLALICGGAAAVGLMIL